MRYANFLLPLCAKRTENMKRGLVLEGGAMRGLYTCGVIDVMMENNIWPDGVIGVSAGAAFGCNYKSRQPGRAIRYNMRFARDSRYSGLRSYLTTGNYFNAQFCYHQVPKEYDIFDNKAFNENPMEFYVVCTDVEKGDPVYKRLDHADETSYEWIRASSSMPIASKIVELEGRKLLDGGVADSIPLEHFERIGYERNIVILTQTEGYQKTHTRLVPLLKVTMHKYPKMVEAMDRRYKMYNDELAFVKQAEQEGRCLVIRPDEDLDVWYITHNPDTMHRLYLAGRKIGERYLEKIKQFYQKEK